MCKIIPSAFLLLSLCLLGCGEESNTSTSTPAKSETTAPKESTPEEKAPAAPAEEEAAPEPEVADGGPIDKAVLLPFVPEGYEIMDWKAGDLNRDEYEDAVLIAFDPEEKEYDMGDDISFARPVILLTGTPDGSLQLAARNDNVSLCHFCGGVFGDPHNGIAVKNGYFSIEHYGGSNWRWTRIITFKYDESSGTWWLHRDGGDSYHTSNPEKVEENVRTTSDFGKVKFEDFHNENT